VFTATSENLSENLKSVGETHRKLERTYRIIGEEILKNSETNQEALIVRNQSTIKKAPFC